MASIDKPAPDNRAHRDSLHTIAAAPVSGALDAGVVRDWLWAFAQQSLDYAILLVGPDRRVLWASPGAAWTLAATAAEIVGTDITRFFTTEDRAFGIPEQEALVATREGASMDDRWMLRADGSPFWASGRTVALTRHDGQPLGYLKIFRDRTEWQMRVGGLEHQASALVAEGQARTNAIETILHGMDRSLAELHDACSQLRGDPERPTEAATEAIDRLLTSATPLLDALRGCARVGPGAALQVESLQLHEELRLALAAALQRRPRGQRRIELLLPPGLPISFEGDRLALRQAFTHLLDNALKSTADDGTIAVLGTVESAQVVVRIEDDGSGMDAGTLEAVFDLFTGSVSGPDPGLRGIGLALVKRLVHQHGGSVQAASPGVGKGSEFTVRLPIRQPARAAGGPG